MEARMGNPALIVPEALPALLAVSKALTKLGKDSGLPESTLNLVYLRASQINGCSVCVDMHCTDAKKAGETDQRLFATAAWREAPFFTEPERAALALTEAATRLSDRGDAVPDEVYGRAAEHYDENAMAALVMGIGMINLWNRLNATTRQVAGGSW